MSRDSLVIPLSRLLQSLTLCLLLSPFASAQTATDADQESEVGGTEQKDAAAVPTERDEAFETLLRELTASGLSVDEIRSVLKQYQPGDTIPDFQITHVRIDGSVESVHARLTAEIRVRVQRTDGAVRVPLMLNEARLTERPVYQGPGTAIFDTKSDPEAGMAWWFRGAGEHVLKLGMAVPVREQPHARHRLRLTVPLAASSRMTLNVPAAPLAVQGNEESSVQTSAGENGGTRIQVWGLRRQCDLQWERRPTDIPVRLSSSTTARLDVTSEPYIMTAEQTIELSQGAVNGFRVTLPAGFRLIRGPELQGDANAGILGDVTVDDQSSPNVVTFSIAGPPADQIRLQWELAHSLPLKGQGKLTVEPFSLDQAQDQTTDIDIVAPEGFQMEQLDAVDVRRSRVSVAVGKNQIATSYRMLTDRARVILDIHEVAPLFTVTPHWFLRMSENRMAMHAQYTVRVHRGGVQRIPISWPGLESQGWTVEPTSLPGFTEWTIDERGDEHLVLRLIDRTTQDFEFAFDAIRVPDNIDLPLDVSLPAVDSASRELGTLVVVDTENLESVLEAADQTEVLPLSEPRLEIISLPEGFSAGRRSGFLVASPQAEFSAELSTRERTIATESTLLAKPSGEYLDIFQTVTYRVDFDRLHEVRLDIPDSLNSAVDLRAGGFRLVQDGDEQEEGRFLLPEPMENTFQIEARYRVGLPRNSGNQPAELTIPVIRSADAVFRTTRFEVDTLDRIEVTFNDEDWQPGYSPDHDGVWSRAGAVPALTIQVRTSAEPTIRSFIVRRSLDSIELDAGCRIRTDFLLEGTFDELALVVPQVLHQQEIRWNGERLDAGRVTPTVGSPGTLTLAVGETSPGAVNRLTVICEGGPSGLADWIENHRFVVPRLAHNVWTRESLCELVLPVNQHLALMPASFTPRYEWVRRGIFWQRESHTALALPEFQTPDAGDNSSTTNNGDRNRYLLGRIGATGVIEFSTMNQSSIVLAGAGFALLLGMLPVVRSRIRTGFAILAIVFFTTCAAIPWPGIVVLLLQPAAAGLVLAIIAAVVDSRRRRGTRGRLIQPEPADLRVFPSNDTQYPIVPSIDSEDPTAVRNLEQELVDSGAVPQAETL